MNDRFVRLNQALADAGYDAYLASQRPNQLYWTESAEPVSDLPNVAYMLLSPKANVIFPGQAFYYGVVEHLSNYEIAPTEVGTPSAQAQLVEQVSRRGYRRPATTPRSCSPAGRAMTGPPARRPYGWMGRTS